MMNNVVLTAAPMEAIIGKKIASQLGVDFTPFHITTFPSGEFCIDASEMLTGKTVISCKPFSCPTYAGDECNQTTKT